MGRRRRLAASRQAGQGRQARFHCRCCGQGSSHDRLVRTSDLGVQPGQCGARGARLSVQVSGGVPRQGLGAGRQVRPARSSSQPPAPEGGHAVGFEGPSAPASQGCLARQPQRCGGGACAAGSWGCAAQRRRGVAWSRNWRGTSDPAGQLDWPSRWLCVVIRRLPQCSPPGNVGLAERGGLRLGGPGSRCPRSCRTPHGSPGCRCVGIARRGRAAILAA